MSLYLKCLEEAGIEPNFWCSEEYFQLAEFEERTHISEGEKVLAVYENEECEIGGYTPVLPPFNLTCGQLHHKVPRRGIWADLVGYSPKNKADCTCKFLDYNYVYDPAQFVEMKGRRWSTFRKNSRKFPRRYGEGRAVWRPGASHEAVGGFASKVFDEIRSEEIHDAEVAVKYIFDSENCHFLVDEETGKILAVNIWDENYKYINYRYAFCVDQPFLSEYVRLCFYQTVNEKYSSKLVNDGGVLDRESLKRFKDKLNPVGIFKIHSWER